MTIGSISDGEAGSAVRTKLNLVIAAANVGGAITYTGDPTGLTVTVVNQALNIGDLAVAGLVATTPSALTLNGLTALGFGASVGIQLGGSLQSSSLQTLNFGSVATIIGVLAGVNNALTTFTAASLHTITSSFTMTFNALTTLSLPALVVGDIGFTADLLTTLNLPLWEDDNNQGFQPALAAIATISLPSVKHIDGGVFVMAANLVTFSMNAGLLSVTNDFYIQNAKLNQASVDGVLVRLAALNGTGGTTSFDNQTVDLSGGTNAAPGATGLTAKGVLEGRGCTVNVN